MKCPMCDGIGYERDYNTYIPAPCTRCRGSGEIEPTNEEWLRSCSTEELAEELDRISMNESSYENWLWWLEQERKG